MAYYTSILEGEQRDRYVARKAVEADRAETNDNEHDMDRFRKLLHGAHERNTTEKTKDAYAKAANAAARIEDKRRSDNKEHAEKAKELRLAANAAEDYVRAHINSKRPQGLFKGKEKREYDEKKKEYIDRFHDARKEYKDHVKTANKEIYPSEYNYRDAIARHNRRHPDRMIECGIFESCEFIY